MGKFLAEQIHRNIEFYAPIFEANLGTVERVFQEINRIKLQIGSFYPDYVREIDSIALGAGVS